MTELTRSPGLVGAAPTRAWRLIDRARRSRFAGEGGRYLAASVAALVLDAGLLVALTEGGHAPYLAASAISYLCGGLLHYILSVTLVFRQRRLSDWRVELLSFLAIGLLGLAVTQAVLAVCVEALGVSYVIGKAAAVGASFLVCFLGRRTFLFMRTDALS